MEATDFSSAAGRNNRRGTGGAQSGYISAEISKRERVTQLLKRRNAVFPFPPRRTGKEVRRAGLQTETCSPPLAIAERFTQARVAWGSERQAHHIVENGPVLVPADRRAWRIFRDQDLLQVAEYESGCGLDFLAEFPQNGRNRIGRQGFVLVNNYRLKPVELSSD
jgi:hypothetical protein